MISASGFTNVVVVRHPGDVVVSEAWGYATHRWQIPNTVDTRFDTASITKLFTSVAVLQQVGAGRLDLDVSIHRYIDLSGTMIPRPSRCGTFSPIPAGSPMMPTKKPARSTPTWSWTRRATRSWRTADFLPQFAHEPALAKPGVPARYCNVSFVLAGLALERVVGESYRSYVTREIFES
ncbi:MAG TPA: serine hydrolase domain-containing protein [Microlunatus sp.]